MKRFLILVISILSFALHTDAQERLVDATDNTPIAFASIFDSTGNVVGFTSNEGDFSKIPASSYPISLRCIGYEQLVIERPANKVWKMTPITYNLKEVVVVPVKRNILKQTFYIREYFSLNSESDTVTFFIEHMAHRFVPTSKDAKFGGDTSLRILNSRSYSRFQISDKDIVNFDTKAKFPSMTSICDLKDKDIMAPESFKESGNTNKVYKKSSKSGPSLIQRQNAQVFTSVEDLLAGKKDHSKSIWLLKLVGFDIEFNEFNIKHVYRANNEGIYPPKDLLEANLTMQADGKGKKIRRILNSEKPVIIRASVELYTVGEEFLSKEEAKEEYEKQPSYVKYVIPANVPALNKATQQLVDRAKAEAKNKNKNN